MSFQLHSHNGEPTMTMNNAIWESILNTAHQHGWQPMGTQYRDRVLLVLDYQADVDKMDRWYNEHPVMDDYGDSWGDYLEGTTSPDLEAYEQAHAAWLARKPDIDIPEDAWGEEVHQNEPGEGYEHNEGTVCAEDAIAMGDALERAWGDSLDQYVCGKHTENDTVWATARDFIAFCRAGAFDLV